MFIRYGTMRLRAYFLKMLDNFEQDSMKKFLSGLGAEFSDALKKVLSEGIGLPHSLTKNKLKVLWMKMMMMLFTTKTQMMQQNRSNTIVALDDCHQAV